MLNFAGVVFGNSSTKIILSGDLENQN